MIRKLSLFLISSSQDLYGPPSVLVLARVLPPVLSLAALCSLLAPSRSCPFASTSPATQHAPPSAQAPLPTRLPRLSSRLHCLAGWKANACSCATLVRGEKPAGSPQAREYRGLCLSQPAMPVLRHHRCSHACAGRRWQAWPSRADPDVSLSGLPHHLHCPVPSPLIPFENPFPSSRHGARCAGEGLDASTAERVFGSRQATSTSLSVARWRARSDVARTLLSHFASSRTSN
jgi:hypothetical protein